MLKDASPKKMSTPNSNSIFDMVDRNAWTGATHTRRRKFRRLISLSYHSSFLLGRWFPNAIPLVYVVGYPKSGTSWVGQLIADYLQLPFPQHSIFPIGFPAVIQGHQSIDSKFPAGVYAVRDGRDVVISGFHHLKSQFLAGGGSSKHRKYYKSIDLEAPLVELLPSFIEHSVKHPWACKYHWGDHVKAYFKASNSKVEMVHYEKLLADPAATLTELIEKLSNAEADIERVRDTVNRYSFARQSGGKEQKDSYFRKGKKGDWRNHFDRNSAELFQKHFGEALVLAGYEADGSWVQEVTG